MGRVNYGFKDRYLLTATLRRDGYSGFAKNNKFGLFPSLGLGWVVSDEPFFKKTGIDYLKFRASYGQNGNQTSRYSSLARLSAGEGSRYVFGDGGQTSIGQSVASLANNDLTWETTTGTNIGIDFNLLKRISGSLDYYNTRTNDLLYNLALPQLTGFSNITTNLGEIRNTGFEAIVNYNAIKKNSFRWDITANFSTNNNRIESLLGIDDDGDGIEDDLVASGLFIGRSIGTIFDFQTDGIYQIGDDIPAGFFPGTYRIVDQNNDGVINPLDDRVFLGQTEPAYRFGIQNTIAYKGFTMRLFIHSVQGAKNRYRQANHPFGVAGTTGTAQNSNWFNNFDYWSSVNPDGQYPQPWQIAQVRPVAYFSRNFVRLQDISLAYDFTPALIKKVGMQNLKLFVSGKNLMTITQWDGWDPETGQGIGNNQGFPLMKGFTAGLDVSF
jgi:TonB-linked SusC/RagA family outer membrane protein